MASHSKGSAVVTVLLIPVVSAVLFVFFSVMLEVIEVVSNARVAAEGAVMVVLGVTSVLVAGVVLVAPRAWPSSSGRGHREGDTPIF